MTHEDGKARGKMMEEFHFSESTGEVSRCSTFFTQHQKISLKAYAEDIISIVCTQKTDVQ